jgi:hypothetical protein
VNRLFLRERTKTSRNVTISFSQSPERATATRGRVQLVENIKISAKVSLGYFELRKHKPWFDEGCSKLLDQRKEAKLQWLQDPSEINGVNLNNVRCEASRYFRNKERDYLKGKSNEPAMNIKNKNIRDLYIEIN